VDHSVGDVADLAGVSVRTLHHYDEIGLLRPRGHTRAGYRRYGDEDLERLQQIMFYRELGFPLKEIVAILADPTQDATAHLRHQHKLLTQRLTRVQAMVTAVERAMEARKMGINLTPEERFEVFGENDPARYADEAEQRWGDTEAYKESHRRTSKYTKADWEQIKAETVAVQQRMADVMAAGEPATSAAAMDAAEAHRRSISKWFYDCGYDIHRGLAEMYLSDERFTRNYEQVAPGLARYVHDAILANAQRNS
jgi:MerR family transcriptional regulator, thiopeptide resistance regulator